MKIKLLKPLPGAEVGTIFPNLDKSIQDGYIHVHLPYARIRVDELISSGWAEEIKERWEPKEGKVFYSLNLDGDAHDPISKRKCHSNYAISRASNARLYGLATETREELETTLLLMKLRQSNGGWKPKRNEQYFSVSIEFRACTVEFDDEDDYKIQEVILGNCYRTREEAEKYAPEWKKLFSSINKE